MRRWVALTVCLIAVVVLQRPTVMPARPHGTVTPISVPRAPISWSVLGAALDAQARWYAEAASRPAVVHLRPATRKVQRSSSEIEACILARENGGDYGRSRNPSHFGAYQFDRETWAANGGDPNTWGSASPEEQDRVFRNTVDAHGYGAWTPYDGC